MFFTKKERILLHSLREEVPLIWSVIRKIDNKIDTLASDSFQAKNPLKQNKKLKTTKEEK